MPSVELAVSLAPAKLISTQIIDFAPASLNAWHSAAPIPLAAPVTTTLLFDIFIIFIKFIFHYFNRFHHFKIL